MEQLMTSEEVAEFLHVDPVTIRRLINKGELSAYRIGADYRIAPMDVANYLQRQRVTANAEVNNPDTPLEQFKRWMRKSIHEHPIHPEKPFKFKGEDKFANFTKRAKKVLHLAREEARRHAHNYIGTEHLLLGIVREGEGLAAQVLTKLDVNLEQVRSSVEAIIEHGDRIVTGEVGMTPRAKKVIELANEEAKFLGHAYIGTEHLLLGLIRQSDGIGARVLNSLGVKLEEVRSEILRLLAQVKVIPPQAERENEEQVDKENQPVHICANCGTQYSIDSKFCNQCGHKLSNDEEQQLTQDEENPGEPEEK